MRRLKRSLVLFSLLCIAGSTGCGDDGGDGGDTADAAPQPDAAADVRTLRTGSIAILDTRLLIDNAGTETVAAAGSVVSLGWSDRTLPVPDVAFELNVNALTGCTVTVFDVEAGEAERPIIDEGDVTITGTRLPIGTCAFDSDEADYRCSLQTGTVPDNGVVNLNGNGTATVLFTGETPFVDLAVVGAHIEFKGFPEATGSNNGVFPIIAKDGGSLTIVNEAATLAVPVGAGVSYTIVSGLQPIPVAVPGLQPGIADPDDVDFLGEGVEANTITIAKAEGDLLVPFTKDIIPSGDGFQLASNSAKPYGFPGTAEPLTFSCAPEMGGICGNPGVGVAGLLLNGRTTDAPLDGVGPTDMPAAQKSFATFRCTVATVGAETLTLPLEGVQAILGTAPTRIETSIMHITADPNEPSPKVAGHSLTGFTDVAPSTMTSSTD